MTPARVPPSVIVGDCVRSAVPRRRSRLRQTEVEDLHDPVGRDLDIGGLQIAVDDALLVRRVERFGDLPRDGQRLVERMGPRAMRSASVSPSTSSSTNARIPSASSSP